MSHEAIAGVLITGVYGTGKSSVAEEIAESLETRSVPFGAVDLDWLMWFGVPGRAPDELRRVFLRNLSSVVSNYRAAGVLRFVLAGAVRDQQEVGDLQAAAGMPLRVVRLVVRGEEIERRLQASPTTGRRADLEVARQWLDAGVGAGFEDKTIVNEGPIACVAETILEWLGWHRALG